MTEIELQELIKNYYEEMINSEDEEKEILKTKTIKNSPAYGNDCIA
jgi:hypothetical protein